MPSMFGVSTQCCSSPLLVLPQRMPSVHVRNEQPFRQLPWPVQEIIRQRRLRAARASVSALQRSSQRLDSCGRRTSSFQLQEKDLHAGQLLLCWKLPEAQETFEGKAPACLPESCWSSSGNQMEEAGEGERQKRRDQHDNVVDSRCCGVGGLRHWAA